MPMDKMEMSRRQEETLEQAIGGRRTKGSGSQWTDQTDARAHHLDVEFAFAVECKSTGGQSIAVTREILAKLIEQAGGERPALALRIYENDRLDVLYDFVAVRVEDLSEMLERLNIPTVVVPADAEEIMALRAERTELLAVANELRQELAAVQAPPLTPDHARLAELEIELANRPTQDQHRELMGQYAQAQAAARSTAEQLAGLQQMVTAAEAESPVALASALGAAQNTIHFQRQVIGTLQQQAEAGSGRRNDLQAAMAAPPPNGPDGKPILPWSVIHKDTLGDGTSRLHGMRYDETGAMAEILITKGAEVQVGPVGAGAERAIFVDGLRIRAGDLYVGGVLHTRVMPLEKALVPVNPLEQT